MTHCDPNSAPGADQPGNTFPWREAATTLRSVIELNQAFAAMWNQTGAAATENWPKTERELLKWHKNFLYTCIDYVDQAIKHTEEAEAAMHAAREAARAAAQPPAADPATPGRERIPVL